MVARCLQFMLPGPEVPRTRRLVSRGDGCSNPAFKVRGGDYSTTHWADVAGDGSKVEKILINLNIAGIERRTVRSAERWV